MVGKLGIRIGCASVLISVELSYSPVLLPYTTVSMSAGTPVYSPRRYVLDPSPVQRVGNHSLHALINHMFVIMETLQICDTLEVNQFSEK